MRLLRHVHGAEIRGRPGPAVPAVPARRDMDHPQPAAPPAAAGSMLLLLLPLLVLVLVLKRRAGGPGAVTRGLAGGCAARYGGGM